ncbi:helix-turn-helix transcriptional regulator [Sphingomonas sp. CFBP 8760]|nr:helix-turn-helix transcriptional regulator [Sphingomonas sp. CFBP 8760]
MSKSAFTDAHRVMVAIMAQTRRDVGLHQAELAQLIGKDQSFISNIERGQRRVDIIEFIAITRAMGVDPVDIFRRINTNTSSNISI